MMPKTIKIDGVDERLEKTVGKPYKCARCRLKEKCKKCLVTFGKLDKLRYAWWCQQCRTDEFGGYSNSWDKGPMASA